jgi:hypothetical protein
VYAIAYDAVEVLEKLASDHGICYPLLSDHDSAFIREVGIFNDTTVPGTRSYGIPYPGTFVIDADGRVESKVFHESAYVRDASATAMRELLGFDMSSGPSAEWQDGQILIRAALDTDDFVRQRRVGWRVAIGMPEGFHVYGSPVPDGFAPLRISVSVPEGVVGDGPRYPFPNRLTFPFVDGEVPVYHGAVEITGGLTFADIREDVMIDVTVQFQACTDTECFAPGEARVSLPIRYTAFE